MNMQEIIQELKTELYNAKKKARALSTTDEAQLYYTGVIVGLQKAIGKYEQEYYGTKPTLRSKGEAKKKRERP
jgi:hypothetical protein